MPPALREAEYTDNLWGSAHYANHEEDDGWRDDDEWERRHRPHSEKSEDRRRDDRYDDRGRDGGY